VIADPPLCLLRQVRGFVDVGCGEATHRLDTVDARAYPTVRSSALLRGILEEMDSARGNRPQSISCVFRSWAPALYREATSTKRHRRGTALHSARLRQSTKAPIPLRCQRYGPGAPDLAEICTRDKPSLLTAWDVPRSVRWCIADS
jgi:hypothetical protein